MLHPATCIVGCILTVLPPAPPPAQPRPPASVAITASQQAFFEAAKRFGPHEALSRVETIARTCRFGAFTSGRPPYILHTYYALCPPQAEGADPYTVTLFARGATSGRAIHRGPRVTDDTTYLETVPFLDAHNRIVGTLSIHVPSDD